MINVLVVDDDKLVRKGLISSMPWEDFGMRVVGEAKNGEKALEFLETGEVDLLLTDLAMPVMSGIELMRVVRKRYPGIFIVVLTLHQDFEYIQEALRLGAIDYIAKVELERESFERVLERIRGRIVEERRKGMKREGGSETFETDRGCVLVSAARDPEGRKREEELLRSYQPVELDDGLWFWLPPEDGEFSAVLPDLGAKSDVPPGHRVLIRLGGLQGENRNRVYRLLREYKETGFFYDYMPGTDVMDKTVDRLSPSRPHPDEEELASGRQQWLSLGWVHQDSVFEALLEQARAWQLPPSRLIRFLLELVNEWNRIYYSVTLEPIRMPDSFVCWHEVREWLSSVRQSMSGAIGKSRYSEEVRDCITRAVQLIHEQLADPVHSADIAKRVNMSRSYFSQCFRDLVGMTFHEYVRHVRMEKAREYLLYTNKTIAWIAENTGYADEKYFSRIFRDCNGMPPSEFRQKHRSEAGMETDGGKNV